MSAILVTRRAVRWRRKVDRDSDGFILGVVRPPSPPARFAAAAFACALGSGGARGGEPVENGQWMTALSSAFVVVDMSAGDLDNDGRDETALCYRHDLATTTQGSGVVVLQGKGPEAKPVFHVQLSDTLCEKVRIAGGRVGVLLPGNKQLAWAYGKEIHFRSDKASPVAAKSVSASSTLDPSHAASKAYDNDLATSWAEGADGTGIGQTLTVRLDHAVDVGAVALLCGDGNGQRAFLDRNRVHRGSIETKTEADLGDADSGIDFSSLGISTIGDRIEFACENKPQITYVDVGKRGVVELTIRIDSVFLGDKKDDTHIAEVEIVPVLDPTQTLDRARDVKKKADTEAEATTTTATIGVDVDASTKKLDDGGRSIVPDDE